MKVSRVIELVLLALFAGAFIVACSGPNGGGPRTAEGTHLLTVTVSGPGSVEVAALGITCRDECSGQAGAGTTPRLVAKPDSGKAFVGWEGACSGSEECAPLMDGDVEVRAVFADHALALTMAGDGEGSVRIVPPDATCSSDCGHAYSSAVEQVSLSLTLAEGSRVDGWGGACSGTGTGTFCQIKVSGQTNVSLTLISPPVTQEDTYDVKEDGQLSKTADEGVLANDSDPAGESLTAELVSGPQQGDLDLRSDGSFTYQPNAGASDRDNFTYRARDASGNLSETTNVSIGIIAKETFPLDVKRGGSGNGTVTSGDGSISCPPDCVKGFAEGSIVNLTATAGEGSRFTGWTGCTQSTGTGCSVTMTGARTVLASFTLELFRLEYGADGGGQVDLSEAGESCGNGCRKFEYDTDVTLTAIADEGWEFDRWEGTCSGTQASCTVDMRKDHTATAVFNEKAPAPPQKLPLEVNFSGNGSGRVESQPAGISCHSSDADCSATFNENSTVTLTSSPEGEGTVNWQGCDDVTAQNDCEIMMTASESVTAEFTSPTTDDTTAADDTTESDDSAAGDDTTAGGDDTTGDTGSDEEADSGDAEDEAQAGTEEPADEPAATHVASVELAGDGDGRVVSNPTGIDCSTAGDPEGCSYSFEETESVSLAATEEEGSSFSGWSGACSGAAECSFTMSEPREVTATFDLETNEDEATSASTSASNGAIN